MSERDDQKFQVQQATDIVRLVGEDIALKPKGKEFVGLCAFHEDRNPSMCIVPQKQIYHCFVCGAGGDVFSWMMNYHKMSFPQALEHLAQRAGITLEQFTPRDKSEGPSQRELLLEANESAVRFFRAMLAHPEQGRAAREYLDKRGISAEMLEAFQIGYAPDTWDSLTNIIREKGKSLEVFHKAGLVHERDKGGYYDAMRHRIIFPISGKLGQTIAFGGRRMREEDNPKYLNSPDTLLFKKSTVLYGLAQARKHIIAAGTAVIVEGYTDVIAAHQADRRNALATLGTALTREHTEELRHYAHRVVLIFDGDEAGMMAADRAVEIFLTGSMDVAIAVLPGGADPAELLANEDGVAQWDAAVEDAVDAIDYQYDRFRKRIESTDSITAREKAAKEYLEKLSTLGLGRTGPIRRGLVVQRVARLLGLTEKQVESMIASPPPQAARSLARPTPPPPTPIIDEEEIPVEPAEPSPFADDSDGEVDQTPATPRYALAERGVIGCLLREPSAFHQTLDDGRGLDESLTPMDFVTVDARKLYDLMYTWLAEQRELTLGTLVAELASRNEHTLAQLAVRADAEVEARTGGDSEKRLAMVVAEANVLIQRHREGEYRQARQQINDADDRALRELIEHNRSNPNPARIARNH